MRDQYQQSPRYLIKCFTEPNFLGIVMTNSLLDTAEVPRGGEPKIKVLEMLSVSELSTWSI